MMSASRCVNREAVLDESNIVGITTFSIVHTLPSELLLS